MSHRWLACLPALLLLPFASCHSDRQSSGADAPALERLSIQVPLALTDGCRLQGGECVLLDQVVAQGDPGVIVFEAENALSCQYQEGVGVLKAGRKLDRNQVVQVYAGEEREYAPQEGDPQAVGKFIDYTHQAIYLFQCTQSGKYTVWARHYLPFVCGWQYRQQIDDAAVSVITLSNLPAKQWFWTKCGEWELAAGSHVFSLTNLHGGKRVDRIVLARGDAFRPQAPAEQAERERVVDGSLSVFSSEPGPAASPLQPVAAGVVTSEPLELVGARRLESLLVYAELNGGAIEAEISLDGGRTWRAVPADGDLAGLVLAEQDRPCIRFHLRRGAENAPSPRLLGAELSVQADPAAYHVLRNNFAEYRFSAATGAPCGIYNRATRQAIQPPGLATNPFELRLVRPPPETGDAYPAEPLPDGINLSLADARVVGVAAGRDRIESVYELLDGKVRLVTTVTLDESSPESHWSVRVENHSALEVLAVRFPRLARVKVGGRSTDDVLAWGHIGGEMITTPASRGEWRLSYPGRASVPFLDLFDDAGGFYFAAYDPELFAMDLEVAPCRDRDYVNLSMQKRHRLRSGEVRSWEFAAAPHAGSWHWGADRYREFFQASFGKSEYPRWLRECDGWIAASWMGLPLNRTTYEREFRRGFDQALRYGYDYVQTWATTGRSACPTYYLPLKELGGEEAFAAANRAWHNLGGKVGYYFHGNAIGAAYLVGENYWLTPWSEYPPEVRPPAWDWYVQNRHYPAPDLKIDRAPFEEMYRKAMAYERDGNQDVNTNLIDSYENMSFKSPSWLDYQAGWAARYNRQYWADVIYWDTFAWGGDDNEFNPYYRCFGEGDLTPVRRAFLKRCRDEAFPSNPDFAQLTEGCVDVYGTYCYHMISGFTRNPEIFRYTIPDQIVFEGHQNGGWNTWERDTFGRLASAFLFGNKFDIYDHLAEPIPVRELIALRKWFSPWQNHARFLDTLGLELASPDLKGKVHLVDENQAHGLLVTLKNAPGLEGVKVTVDLRRHGVTPRRAFLFELGRMPRPLPFSYNDGIATFVAPAGRVSAALFVDQAAGAMAWHPSVWQDESAGLCLRTVNFAGEPLAVTWRCDGVELQAMVPPGAADLQRMLPADRLSLELPRKLELEATADGLTKPIFQGLYPAAYDRSFERYGTPCADAPHGTRAAVVRQNQQLRVELSLKEGRRYLVSFQCRQDQGGASAYLRTMSLTERFWGDDPARNHVPVAIPFEPGKWVKVEAVIPVFGRGYLCLMAGPDNLEARFDDVTVMELPEADSTGAR